MEAKVLTDFSERFEQIKAHFGLKNRDLAHLGEVSDTAISKVISGATKTPDVSTLINLVKKLHLNPEWLLMGTGKMIQDNTPADTNPALEHKIEMRDQYVNLNPEWLLTGTGKMIQDKTDTNPALEHKIWIRDQYIKEMMLERDDLLSLLNMGMGKDEGVSDDAGFVMNELVDDCLGMGGKMFNLHGWNHPRENADLGTPIKPLLVFGGTE